MYFINN